MPIRMPRPTEYNGVPRNPDQSTARTIHERTIKVQENRGSICPTLKTIVMRELRVCPHKGTPCTEGYAKRCDRAEEAWAYSL
jgi:hypothetical protein